MKTMTKWVVSMNAANGYVRQYIINANTIKEAERQAHDLCEREAVIGYVIGSMPYDDWLKIHAKGGTKR